MDIRTMVPEQIERERLLPLQEKIDGLSEMKPEEQFFLNGIVRAFKPKKSLELGISAGGGSAIILNAIRDIDGSTLHSVDYSERWYKDHRKRSGFVVEERCPELRGKWRLHAGGVAARFIDEIGDGIDFCLIDTAHVLPGEVLDFLMVCPFFHKGTVVVFHDLCLHTWPQVRARNSFASSLIFNAIDEPKITIRAIDPPMLFPNIGAVQIDNDMPKVDYIDDLLRFLTFPWKYVPSPEETDEILYHFSKHYRPDQVDLLRRIFFFQRENGASRLKMQVNRFKLLTVQLMTGLIPVKKWRKRARAFFVDKLYGTAR